MYYPRLKIKAGTCRGNAHYKTLIPSVWMRYGFPEHTALPQYL